MDLQIVLQISLVIIGLYLALFKSYFTEKGKNIATNEDIEELTNKIELVKQKFLEKNASLKSKLDLLTNLQIGHKNDERNALTEFHKSFSKWINILTSSSFGLIDDYNNEEVLRKLSDYDNIYKEFQSSHSLLMIYVEDEKLHSSINTLKIKILEKLSGIAPSSLISLKHNNEKLEDLKSQPYSDKKTEKNRELFVVRKEIHQKYHREMIEAYKEIVDLQKSYEKHMLEYIKTLSQE
ncbi:hypothetical protein B0A79_01960 [Flavobacterium piscis]|uniref:Uncharacterized protein n=1 Tax=Flavobacterium piscis TaxID=1114874 RepID=A0ABX2XN43_9FLAO|nr:hypothetical protein [Flavobacterium piscis]OCB77157.1 hypothetical protein FLP_04235 [Flavobacterium piscis]OXG07796.1 hypothetical protein B0A79_01960 [Flavobacterium piscis]